MNSAILYALLGGGLIGLASAGMLLANGRILGVSGILGGALRAKPGDTRWRVLFLAGLILGGLLIEPLGFTVMSLEVPRTWIHFVIGGFLVGLGTTIGNGCTSGHGVCGVSRLSPRSLVATATFMIMGIAAVGLIDHLFKAVFK